MVQSGAQHCLDDCLMVDGSSDRGLALTITVLACNTRLVTVVQVTHSTSWRQGGHMLAYLVPFVVLGAG